MDFAAGSLFMSHPDPMWIYEQSSLRFLHVNNSAIAKYGYSRDEFLAMTIADIRPPQDRAALAAKVAALTGGRREAGVWRHYLKSGELIYVDITGHGIEYEGVSAELISARDVSRLVVAEQIAHDAFEREKAARHLSDMLARQLQAMFNAVPGMFLVFAPGTYNVVAVSEDYLAVAGVARSDVVGRDLFEVLPRQSDDGTRAALRQSIQAVSATRRPRLLDPQRFLVPRPDATRALEEHCWLMSNAPISGPDGQLLLHMLRIHDVSAAADALDNKPDHPDLDLFSYAIDLKSDNLRLTDLATRLRVTQRLLDTGIWEYWVSQDRVDWSNNVYAIYGVAAEKFGHGLEDYFALVHPNDRAAVRAKFSAFLQSGAKEFTFAHQISRPNGGTAHVRGVAERIETSQGPVLSGVVQNVTADVEAARALARAKRMLEIAGTSAKFGAWRYDTLTAAITWSPQTARIHDEPEGFSPTVAEGLSYYLPEHRERIAAHFQACVDRGERFDDIAEIVTAKGRRLSVSVTGEAERDGAGGIVAVQGSFQDISDLIAAQRKADELSTSLTETLENIGDAFYTLDREWCFTYMNGRAEALLGRQRDLLIGRNMITEFPEVAGTDFQIQYAHALQTGATVRFEQSFPPLQRVFRVNAHPTPQGLAVYFSDVTAERQKHEQLRLLEAAVSRLNDLVVITEAGRIDGPLNPRIVYVNDAFERRTGFTRGEVLGRTPRILQGPRTDRSELERMKAALMAFQPVRAEVINYTKDGQEYWVELDIIPIANEAGRFTHFVAIKRDITDRRLVEEALRLSEARFRLIARATGNAIWEWDAVAGQRRWSDGLAEIFGHQSDAEGLLTTSWQDNVHPDDLGGVQEALDQLLSGTSPAFSERYRFRRADDSWATVEDRAFVVHDDEMGGTRIVGSMNDISDRASLEERLRQSQKLEAVGQLTGGVAHDFNNLLTIIIGNTELLQDELESGSSLRHYADMTALAADRAAELTSRLLSFSRKQPLQPRVIDVNAAISGIEGLLRRTLGENIDIKITQAESLWRTEVDLGQLESTILNLAINSRDAMPGGGALTIETANAILDDAYVASEPDLEPGQYVTIAVSDTGRGIPQDQIHRVFEPFYTTKPVGKGTGLGLSMVYGFVKQTNGHVRIYSEVNEGTTIKLYFPRFPGDQVSSVLASENGRLVRGHETILVVEDDKMILQHVTALLTDLGYQVVGASEGLPALAILRERPDIDLLFTDVILTGGMNGRQIADAAQAIRPGLKVLYTSGYSENAIVHHGRLDPEIELLSKPYRRFELATRIRAILDA